MLGQKKIENMMIPCEISKDRPNGEDNKLSFQHFECELPMETNNCKNNHDPFTQAPRGARPLVLCSSCAIVTKALRGGQCDDLHFAGGNNEAQRS